MKTLYSFLKNPLSSLNVFGFYFFLGFFIYGHTLAYPFVHDDVVFIVHNPFISDLDLRHILYQTAFQNDRFPIVNIYYRPILELVNRLLYQFFLFDPAGYHLANIFLHIVNSFFVYCLTKRIFQNHQGISLTAGVLFLTHPIQTEAVTCIAGISNLLFTFFILGMILIYFRLRLGIQSNKKLFYILSFVIFLLSLLTKEQTVVVPILILVLDFCFWRRPNYSYLAACFFILAGYFVLKKILFGAFLGNIFVPWGEFVLRVLTIPKILLTNIGLIFFPHGLHYYRSVDMAQPPWGWGSGFILLSLCVFLFIQRGSKEQRRVLLFAIGWFLISQIPTLNIYPLVNEYSLLLASEHFLYFPLVGMLIFILGVGKYFILDNERLKALEGRMISLGFLLVCVISGVFLFLSRQQTTFWRGEIPLFERTLAFQPHFGRVRMLLAKAYAFEGRFPEALEEYWKALRIFQGYTSKVKEEVLQEFYLHYIKEAYMDMAHCYEAMGKFEDSILMYQEVLSIDRKDGVLYSNLAFNYLKLKNISTAAEYFQKASDLNPQDLMMKNNLAICYKELGRLEEAESLLREVAQKDPQSQSAGENLQRLLNERNKNTDNNF